MYEPDPSSGNTLTLQTSYAYNALGLLTQVAQGAQTRTYVFDALGRLNSSTTPEAGTVCFGTLSGSTCQANGYDSFDNLLYRTDARGVVTNYLYDSLNRLTGVTYPTVPSGVAAMPNVCKANGSATNNANVCYTYGTSPAGFNNGRTASMSDSVGSESYTYDQFGNVTQLAQLIGTTTYTTSYAYNLANQVTQITYPSGRAVVQNLDTLGRLTSVVGTFNSVQTTYASGFSYNTAQQLSALKYGNNLYASFGFAPDTLAMQCLDYSTTNRSACAHDSTTKFGLNYSFPASPANNGQIASTTDAVDNGRSAAYTYDSLYRLTNATTTGSTAYPKWGLSETYDRFGNRTAQAISSGCTGISCPTNSVSVSTTTNRITGSPYAYDSSGNMTNDGLNTLTYDGESRTTAATNGSSSGVYWYDGKGIRIKKTFIVNSTSTTIVYVFSGSKVIAEYDNGAAASSPSREYVYSGTRLLARIDSSGTKYYHRDHLSNRLVTDSNGNAVSQTGHFPFGESWYNASSDKLVFTSYERDAESGNDYAMARFYVNRLGRFSSQDRFSGTIGNPQSLNRYAYVSNAPIDLVDPFGMLLKPSSDPEDDSSDPGWGWGWGSGGNGGGNGGGGGYSKEITSALGAAAAILNGNNPCADFFNTAAKNPGKTLGNTDIVTVDGPNQNVFGLVKGQVALVPPYMWDAQTHPAFGGFIRLNQNGGFYQTTIRNSVQGGGRLPNTPLLVGPYLGGSLEARVDILLHELGHLLNLLQNDWQDLDKSKANDETILTKCKTAIAEAAKNDYD